MHSLDILLFTMYVCESPADALLNHRCVYIAYLDSVAYLTPPAFRKALHQEVLISYLAFLQRRGYERAYIWACPPTKGDDYILFVHSAPFTDSLSHPPEQRMPNGAVLQRWYHEALAVAHRRGVVTEVTNLVDEYLTGKYGLRDAALLRVPVFPGDHWASAVEEKCADLFNAGGDPFQRQPGESLWAFPAWKKKVPVPEYLRKRKKGSGKIKERLMQKMYECLKDQKAHLLVAKLQPQCANCGRFLPGQAYFVSEEEQKPSRFVPIPAPACFCAACVQHNPAVKELKLAGRVGGKVEPAGQEPAIHSSVFATRSLFLNLSQENHLQFNTVRPAKPADP